MSKRENELGLPLEYGELHEYFDALCTENSAAKNRVLERMLRKHKVKMVLDLTCGTGSQVFWLADCGYEVTGVDFSPALLQIARTKALKEKADVRLLEGDMRETHVGLFDAVITISNAVGHLTKADFEKALKNIHSNLKEGGLYVFDIFNLGAMTDNAVYALSMDLRKTVNNARIRNVQHSKIDRKTGRLTSYDCFTIQEGSSKPKTIKGKFTLQIYTAKELVEMLARNGFETVGQYAIDGSKFFDRQSLNILTVARKLNASSL